MKNQFIPISLFLRAAQKNTIKTGTGVLNTIARMEGHSDIWLSLRFVDSAIILHMFTSENAAQEMSGHNACATIAFKGEAMFKENNFGDLCILLTGDHERKVLHHNQSSNKAIKDLLKIFELLLAANDPT